jgi:hypothetical protein
MAHVRVQPITRTDLETLFKAHLAHNRALSPPLTRPSLDNVFKPPPMEEDDLLRVVPHHDDVDTAFNFDDVRPDS